MIVDDAMRYNAPLRTLIQTASPHIIEVPFEVAPTFVEGGTCGLWWKEQGVEALLPKSKTGQLILDWARPVYPELVLFKSGEDGFITVTSWPGAEIKDRSLWKR